MEKIATEPGGLLERSEVEAFVRAVGECGRFDGKKVLAIIPDGTRSGPIPQLFRLANEQIGSHAAHLDFMIALGTHPQMNERAIARLIGMDEEERRRRYPGVRVMNHGWDIEGTLTRIGRIDCDRIRELTDGALSAPIDVRINRTVFDYDLLLVIGPTFPHEIVGFSGGNKYFFPGVSGGEIIDQTHWLGALCTVPEVIGYKHTPMRRIIDEAASMIERERLCLGFVTAGEGLAGIFFGSPEDAFSRAADLSAKRHVVHVGRRYHTVLADAPAMYDELWVAGKCMFKLMSVVEPEGQLIIHGPHITEVSQTHGAWLGKVGYHIKDYFLANWDRYSDAPLAVLCHAALVKGLGRFESGIEIPEIDVVLATGIGREQCRALNLDYLDPQSIDVNDYMEREEDGVLYVPHAGEYLYRFDRHEPPANGAKET